MRHETITPQEARVRAQELFRAYVAMMALVHADTAGWPLVAEALEAAAADARERIRVEDPRPDQAGLGR